MIVPRPPCWASFAVWVALAPLALTGCSSLSGGPQDGPGARIDPASIEPVVPRAEPKSRYGNPETYVVHGREYRVRDDATGYVAEGVASWYGSKFHGRRTSSGETYDMYALTAAHRSLPLPTYVQVTNLENGRETVVKVNDRGPFHDDRVIDLSFAAATKLGFADSGTARVRVRALTTPGARDQAAADAAPAQAGTEADGEAFIQVGAFARFANAQELRARVAGVDIRPVAVSRARNADGEHIYRVRVGPVGAAEHARVLSELEGAGIGPAQVVHE